MKFEEKQMAKFGCVSQIVGNKWVGERTCVWFKESCFYLVNEGEGRQILMILVKRSLQLWLQQENFPGS